VVVKVLAREEVGVLGAIVLGAIVAIVVMDGGFLAPETPVRRIGVIGEPGSAKAGVKKGQVIVDAVDDRFPIPGLH
jgi:hypothetical protein